MFHPDRAAAMTAFFLEKGQGSMNDIKLAKLQYIAERTAILKHGHPIVDDQGVSLEHGPCLRRTLDLTTAPAKHPAWDPFIAFEAHQSGKADNTVVLKQTLDYTATLSPADLEILAEVWLEFGKMEKWKIKDWCHVHFSEYVDVGKGRSRKITLEQVLEAGGADAEAAKERATEIRYLEKFQSHFGGTKGEPA